MNGLRELIQARREETKKSASISLGASKFVRRGDRRPRPDNNIMDELSGDISSRPQKRSRGDAGLVQGAMKSHRDELATELAGDETQAAANDLKSATTLLRSHGKPIRFFGETANQIQLRSNRYASDDDVLGTRLGVEHHLGVRRRSGVEGLRGVGTASETRPRSSKHAPLESSDPPSLPTSAIDASKCATPDDASVAPSIPSHALSSSADAFSLAGTEYVPPTTLKEAKERMLRVRDYFHGLLAGWASEVEDMSAAQAVELGAGAGAGAGVGVGRSRPSGPSRGESVASHAVSSSKEKRTRAELGRCTEYLMPLWDMASRGILPLDVLGHLEGMAGALARGKPLRALQHHVQWSVGEQDWIVGVTTTGIHARASRNNLFEQDVAHVMNDEKQRKMAVGIRALISFVQRTGAGKANRGNGVPSVDGGESAGGARGGTR